MKEITLTKGKVAFVDDVDFDYLSQWRWCVDIHKYTCYASRGIYNEGRHTTLYLHRVLLNVPKGIQVDHIDGDGLNNTRSNMRICTNQENGFNRQKRTNTTSQWKGVFWNSFARKWEAQIGHNGKSIYLGRFDTEIEAALSYNWAALQIFGQFAVLNEVMGGDGMPKTLRL